MKITIKQLKKLVESTMSDVKKRSLKEVWTPSEKEYIAGDQPHDCDDCAACCGEGCKNCSTCRQEKEELKLLQKRSHVNEDTCLTEELLGDDECPECGCVDYVETKLNGDCYCSACGCTWNSGKGDGSASHVNDDLDDGNDDIPMCPECGSEDVDLDATQHSDFNVCNDCGKEY